MASPKQFNVGIIGYGLSAKIFHIPFVAQTKALRLHAIVQRSPSPGSSAPADHPELQHHTAVSPLLSDPAVDIVIITTPPDTHFDLAIAALGADKHVLVEKPFVPTAREAAELVALARERRHVLCVYQNRRWDADFLTVRKLIANGTLGRLVEFESHFDRLRPGVSTRWKGTLGMDQGGGVLYDLGTHLLDQTYVLLGMPNRVSAHFVRQRDGKLVSGEGEGEEPDSVSIVLSYERDGVLAYVRAGVMSVETRQPRFWVRGTRASYHKHGMDPQEDQIKGGMLVTDTAFGREDESAFGRLAVIKDAGLEEDIFPTHEPETYLAFYQKFAMAVESGREEDIPVPAAEAEQVLRIVEAAKLSVKEKREVSLLT